MSPWLVGLDLLAAIGMVWLVWRMSNRIGELEEDLGAVEGLEGRLQVLEDKVSLNVSCIIGDVFAGKERLDALERAAAPDSSRLAALETRVTKLGERFVLDPAVTPNRKKARAK